ncbi:unnamed protein product [Gongylonema pulchrum]|uniref:Uncharacterized protein n=1 Tax=Gongylonema pulchrum TaxID=637853 RepID=A0A183EFI1_9BILA|nr:unnamed protein product [Gongylonema pulchrum]
MNERCAQLAEVAGENSQQTASCADAAMNLTSAVNEKSHVTVATDIVEKGSKLTGQDGASTAENSEVKRGNEQAINDTRLNVVPAGPLTRCAFDHLKSGGTQRPTSTTRKILTAEGSGVPSEPRTPPFARIDVTQMLVDNASRSGPAYRRRPIRRGPLAPFGNHRFDGGSESNSASFMENRSGGSAAENVPESEIHSEQASGTIYLLLYSRNSMLQILDVSDVTVNTPAKNHDESEASASVGHVVVAKRVRPKEAAQGLRRSTRNRVAPFRRWLGEKPIYRRDEQGKQRSRARRLRENFDAITSAVSALRLTR